MAHCSSYIYSSEQLHQLAHIACPAIYQAAMTGGHVWLSVWDDKGRVKKIRAESSPLRVTERENFFEIRTDVRAIKVTKKLAGYPRTGVSLTENGEPIVVGDPEWLRASEGDVVHASFRLLIDPMGR
jgi:hypothetical protein